MNRLSQVLTVSTITSIVGFGLVSAFAKAPNPVTNVPQPISTGLSVANVPQPVSTGLSVANVPQPFSTGLSVVKPAN
ncbi:MAG: hypothetical protein ACRC6M_04215 [Microcystaceae cyanobacterium]